MSPKGLGSLSDNHRFIFNSVFDRFHRNQRSQPRHIHIASQEIEQPEHSRGPEIYQMKDYRNCRCLIAPYAQEDQRGGSRGVKRAGRASRRWHDRANHRPSQNENDLRNSEPNAERSTNEQVREDD